MNTDRYIRPDMLEEYAFCIPKNYHEQIRNGELTAIATYDGNPENGRLFGVIVTASHQGWLEIVWAYTGKEYRLEVQTAEFLRYCIRREQKTGRYIGAFCEIHMEEATALHRDVLALCGMEMHTVKNNIYELRLSDIRHRDMLMKAAEKEECISLEEADEDILELAEETIADDERPVPVPSSIEWESYDPELSRICIEDDEPKGVLLFSKAADYLVLELAYTVSQSALPAMIGSALSKAEELYPEDQKILVPIVGRGVGDILEKMAPDAERGEILQAVMWFEKARPLPSMQIILDRLLNKG